MNSAATADTTSSALTDGQALAFKICEGKIERGLKTFHEVGQCLCEIRDQRYYRATYPTFEDYCEQRWGFTRQRAHQFIESAKVVENVNNCCQTEPPQVESQARELSKLPDEQQAEAWEATVDRCGGAENVTAAAVRETVEAIREPSDDGFHSQEEEESDEGEDDEPEPPKPVGAKWEELKTLAEKWRRRGDSVVEIACVLEQFAEMVRDEWS